MIPGIIRPLALCIIRKENKLLVMKGYDSKENNSFYRLLGGGIEFSERGEEALNREFQEELDSGLENIHFVTLLENIFEFNGQPGHEIVLIFEADLVEKDIYKKTSMKILDSKSDIEVSWQEVGDFKKAKLILYPKGVTSFI